jgi:hypothetical protein
MRSLRRLGLGLAIVVAASSVVVTVGTGPALARASRTPTGHRALLRAVPTPDAPVASSSCQGCSLNWAGYAQVASKRHTFTEVVDTFVVPTATTANAGTQFAADWIGIGGYKDPTLAQAGIQTVVTTAGHETTVAYQAWTEILPHAEDPLPLTVSAGDTVTVTVQETASDMWLMNVDDITTNMTSGRTLAYHDKGLSAEAIVERPCVQNPCRNPNHLASLAQTTNLTFGPGFFSRSQPGGPAVTVPLLSSVKGATLHSISMTSNNGTTVIATPSAPDVTGVAFTVADGNAAPPAPTI